MLNEMLSDVVYHFTYVKNALNIIKTKRFKLVPSIGTSVEHSFSVKNKIYYMSFARSKTADYTLENTANNAVSMVINGSVLNKNYKGKAIDYWEGFLKKMGRTSEMEDRLYHDKPYINFKNINDVIKEVHIYSDDFQYVPIFELIKECKKNKIPVFSYNDKDAFILQDKRKTISLKDIKELFKIKNLYKPHYSNRPRRDYLNPYLELMFKNKKEQLSHRADQKVWQITTADMYRDDVERELSADIHNFKKDELYADQIHKIVTYMKKHKLKTIRELVDHLGEKWNEILQG